MRNAKTWALAPVIILCLAACGGEADKGGDGATPVPSSKTLSVAIGDEGDLDTLEGVIENAGLSDVLDGKGPYTVFAPANAALGAAGTDLSDEAMKAQSAALLRAHIVPGALTRADILAAIDRGGGGSVQIRTMADGLLTFSRDGEAVIVTAEDGAAARLSRDEILATNGVVQPIDGVLVKAG
ncbi:fasciclin domain-containing protein [Brevundimonas aurifodinae]|uniref:Fasciclin domain-containing protein n=2 Tax=Brevundimonas TaxID=41275 RepID=A0ABV1NKK0_9CAUL|nr:MAG: hypothetical protein B7Z42_08590 [Brevundimonas sp. 12-68-7]OYX29696.1 MAG: hypothetical protein B7Z01_15415 [Brevundimonas subvibrioides]